MGFRGWQQGDVVVLAGCIFLVVSTEGKRERERERQVYRAVVEER